MAVGEGGVRWRDGVEGRGAGQPGSWQDRQTLL